jgi:hypothetical protein
MMAVYYLAISYTATCAGAGTGHSLARRESCSCLTQVSCKTRGLVHVLLFNFPLHSPPLLSSMHPPPQPFRAHSPHALWDTPGACTSASPQLTPSPGSSLPSDNSPSPPSSLSSTLPTPLPQLPGASSPPSPPPFTLPPTTYSSLIVSQQGGNTKNARVLAHGLKLDMPPTAHVPPRAYPFGGLAPASGHYPFNAPPLHIPPIGSHISQSSQLPTLPPLRSPHPHAANPPYPASRRDGKRSPTDPEAYYTPSPASYYSHSQTIPSSSPPPLSAVSTLSSPTTSPATPGAVCRLPPIFQVERQQVTTSATQAASASRRRNEANFLCPVPGCGSTFTRRFNLRGAWDHALCLANCELTPNPHQVT